jgi:phosphohistidine phosphatase SixA
MKRVLAHLSVALLVVACSESRSGAAVAPPEQLRGPALLHALQSGGYTLLVRHARTDRSVPNQETPGTVPALRSEQRNLTAEGEADVRAMRDVVSRFRIPIGEVISSPSYRCRETADAFGPAEVTMALRVFPTTAETRALVVAPPGPGTNRVLVTHHFVIEDYVPGVAPGDVGESEAAVVRPTGDGTVELVGKIALADWQQLAGTPATAPAPARVQFHHAVPEAPPPAPAVVAGAIDPGAAATPTEWPTTPLGQLAAAYLDVFNSGDGDRMADFIEATMVENPNRPTEARVTTYLQLFADHGPLTVTGIQTETAEALTWRANSRRGHLMVTLTASPGHPGRLQSLTFALHGVGGH